jgi:hypothetical protein
MTAVCIFGSRTGADPEAVRKYVESLSPGTVVVTGAAPGVDSWALAACLERQLPVIVIPARWEIYGRAAGPIRNSWMVRVADRGVGFWRRVGHSPGTADCVARFRKAGKPVEVRAAEGSVRCHS